MTDRKRSQVRQAEPAPSLAAGDEAELLSLLDGFRRKYYERGRADERVAKDREKDAAVAAERERCELIALRERDKYRKVGADGHTSSFSRGAFWSAEQIAVAVRSQPAAPEKKETEQ